jgi:rhodanese-related sulfurtransferase
MPDESPAIPEVGPTEARRLVEEGGFLLDVREVEEWDAGHAPEAAHLPMGEVADRLDELPKDRVVVCMCRVGGRSGAVAAALADAGFEVRNAGGGMLAWEAEGLPVVTDAGGTGRII